MNNISIKQHTKQGGAALLTFVIFFLIASVLLVYGISNGAYRDVVQYRALSVSKGIFFASDAAAEDVIYRHRRNMSYSLSESFALNNISVSITKTNFTSHFEFDISAGDGTYVREGFLDLLIGSGTTFGFGLQSGNGGIELYNSSSVTGNVFSNGSVIGASNDIYGDVTSAGSSGLVQSINATGTVRANTIVSTTIEDTSNPSAIDNKAYYDTDFIGSTVNSHICPDAGVDCFPGSSDEPPAAMPITIADIEAYGDEAAAGGIIPGCADPTDTIIIDSNQTIGPGKIPCNLHVEKNNTELTLEGHIWVEGNISTQNGPSFEIDPSQPGADFYVIADNRSNRQTSSKIDIQGSTGFIGSGDDSFVGLVSTNDSNGGTENAIEVDNNSPADEQEVIFAAPQGILLGRNSLKLRAAVADKIVLRNSANVTFDEGLLDPNFSGTGGGYEVLAWEETH